MRHIPQGNGEAATEPCPFCAQDLQGSPVIQHYRAYFSDAYAALKRTVSDALGAVEPAHGGDVPAGFERAVRVTVERRQFWSRFCEVAEVTLDTAAIVRDWRAARDAVVAQLTAKQAAPLERMEFSGRDSDSRGDYRRAPRDDHHDSTSGFRRPTSDRRREGASGNCQLDGACCRSRPAQGREGSAHASDEALCDEYLQERAAKEATEQQRDQAKAALEQHRTTVFPGTKPPSTSTSPGSTRASVSTA